MLPVEGIFGHLKGIDLDSCPDPTTEELRAMNMQKATMKQTLMYKVAVLLNTMSLRQVRSAFRNRLKHLPELLRLGAV